MATLLTGTGKMVGAEVRRVEDPRILLGKSRYVDDVQLPGTVAMAFARSPYAHEDCWFDALSIAPQPGDGRQGLGAVERRKPIPNPLVLVPGCFVTPSTSHAR